MAKVVRKGIARNNKYIFIECQCNNGIDTYARRFLIKEQCDIFVGYGYCERTPDFFIEIKGNEYACLYADGKNITIPYDGEREYDGVCYIKKQIRKENNYGESH